MRRFFRFTIRDLLWLTLVVAVALGWFLRERQFRVELEQVKADYAKRLWFQSLP